MEWKYSSMGIRSLHVGVASLPCAAQAFASMKPETRAALENPSSTSWHDGSIVIDAALAVEKHAGEAGVIAMNEAAVKQSLGPLVAPFLKVTLALFGASPESIIKRMNDSIGTVMRAVTTSWTSTGPRQGRLVVNYLDDVNPVSWPCWVGSLRFIYDLCGVKGEIVPVKSAATAKQMVFDCRWDEKK